MAQNDEPMGSLPPLVAGRWAPVAASRSLAYRNPASRDFANAGDVGYTLLQGLFREPPIEGRISLEVGMKLRVVLEPSPQGGFTVYVPSLPGCISEGNTAEEAMANIREATELYLEPVDDDLAGKEGIEVRELLV